MPEQKYKQNGGEKYFHTQQAESAFIGELKTIPDYVKDKIPIIKTAWAEHHKKPEDETIVEETKFNIKFSSPDEKIRDYGIKYNDNNITSTRYEHMELFYADRNKLYGVDNVEKENLMENHHEFIKKSEKEIASGIELYIQHVANIYNHYVPLRSQLFPEYAKHLPIMKYNIDEETEGETEGKTEGETNGEKNQKRKDTENVLKTIMTTFSEVTTDTDGNSITKTVIEQLHEFIVEGDDDILGRYKTTLNEIYKNDDVLSKIESDETIKNNKLFKILTVFAWEKSELIMDQYEKSLKEDMKGAGPQDKPDEPVLESENTLSPAQRAYRRRAVFVCFLSFVWNSWLLFSTLFSVYSFMTRILDLRQDYIDRGIGDFGEADDGNIFFSWFSVMQEIFTIGIVEMTTNIAQRSTTMAQSLANNTIDSIRYQGHLSWERGFAIYMNDLVSGVLTWSSGVSGEMNFQRSMNELMFEIRQTGLDLRTHAYSINNAITNSIGGMSATTMILLRTLYPEEVQPMSANSSVMLNITSNWVPFVGPIVSSIANSAYVGYTLYDLHTRHGITVGEITQDSLSGLLEQLQNTPGDIRLLYNGLYRRPVLAIEDAPSVVEPEPEPEPEPDHEPEHEPDANTVATVPNPEGGSKRKKLTFKKGRKGKQVKKNRSYRRK